MSAQFGVSDLADLDRARTAPGLRQELGNMHRMSPKIEEARLLPDMAADREAAANADPKGGFMPAGFEQFEAALPSFYRRIGDAQ